MVLRLAWTVTATMSGASDIFIIIAILFFWSKLQEERSRKLCPT